MKCNFCDEKATVFLEQLVAGKTKKMSLCKSCAEERGVTSPDSFSLDDVFGSSQGEEESSKDDFSLEHELGLPSVEEVDLVCDGCGFTIADLKKIGRLGCSACYASFRVAMAPMLESMHKGVKHLGRAPEGKMDAIRQKEQLQILKDKMEKAIQSEEYEKAGGLRDKIRAIEAKMEVAR